MKILVTGASGYIGSRLVGAARREGHDVVIATRRAPIGPAPWIAFDLDRPFTAALPKDIDAVVHLATITSGEADDGSEVVAASGLLAASRAIGARFVFVSSQTARKDAPTPYGRTKWAIERLVRESGGTILRPGMVYGGPEQGLFGKLVALVRGLPVLPDFGPRVCVQPIHVDDCVTALLGAATDPRCDGEVFNIAAVVPVPFRTFLQAIAVHRVRRTRWFVRVPASAVRGMARLLGATVTARLGLTSLVSLLSLPAMPTADDLRRLRLDVRSLSEGMPPAGRTGRRELLAEGTAFLRYVLRAPPGASLVGRYARAVIELRGGRALANLAFARRHPIMLGAIAGASKADGSADAELVWRLDAAMMIAEASMAGSVRFLATGQRSNAWLAAWRMTRAALEEVVVRMVRIVQRPRRRASRAAIE